jgi:hypothetical protein
MARQVNSMGAWCESKRLFFSAFSGLRPTAYISKITGMIMGRFWVCLVM